MVEVTYILHVANILKGLKYHSGTYSSSSKDSTSACIALERKRYYNTSVYLARISVARAAALAFYGRLTNRWNVC